MLVLLALLGALVVGLLVGLACHGTVLIGDRRALNRLAAQLTAEQRMTAATHATLAAMRHAVRRSYSGGVRQ